jgi:hypothetical protein
LAQDFGSVEIDARDWSLQQFAVKVQASATAFLPQTATPVITGPYQLSQMALKLPHSLTGTKRGDSCQPPPPVLEAISLRREELLKTDSISEVILLAAGVLVFMILLLVLVVALTQPC